MSYFMVDMPNMYILDLEKEFGLVKEEVYYIAFFHQGKFHSRPMQIIGKAWGIFNHNYSERIRNETDWKYIYKTKSTFNNNVERQMVFKDDSGYGFDAINVFLIGRTPEEAILRFILFNVKNTVNLKEHELMLLENESHKFQSEQPILFNYVIKRSDFDFSKAQGNFHLEFKKTFTKNKDDILNKEFYT